MCIAKATLSYRPGKHTTRVFWTTVNSTHPANEKTAQNIVRICNADRVTIHVVIMRPSYTLTFLF